MTSTRMPPGDSPPIPAGPRSMTAVAARSGALGPTSWEWDLRSVNGRGLDLRLRLPEGVEGLEAAARAALTARLSRGSVSLALRLARAPGEGAGAVDEPQLARALAALLLVQRRAEAIGLALAPPTPAEVLAQRGVLLAAAAPAPEAGLLAALLADLDLLLAAFLAARGAEGAALVRVLAAQVDEVERLADEARAEAARAVEGTGSALRAALARLGAEVPEIQPARLAQELALLALRADVTEELDRLRAHVAAARALLAETAPVGRRLDFLVQELGREANTLCSKAGSLALTRIGLDLKATIDQMREQVQNVE